MNPSYDAIVIGAGVIGASITYNLSRRGLKVLILERQSVAVGATGASSGLVRMHYDIEVDAALAWQSFHFFRNWRERIGGECGFHRTGFLQIVSPDKNDQLRGNVEMQKRIGILTEVVTAAEVRKLAPMLKTEDFELAAYEPESGYADPVLTTNSFIANAKGCGALLKQDCEYVSVEERWWAWNPAAARSMRRSSSTVPARSQTGSERWPASIFRSRPGLMMWHS
jgi:sarcosine oxidase subunit beta